MVRRTTQATTAAPKAATTPKSPPEDAASMTGVALGVDPGSWARFTMAQRLRKDG